MPELPEVETIRLQLQTKIVGKKIVKITVLEKKQLVGDPKHALNQTITKLERWGKYLSFLLSNRYYLNFHLKMTGQILYADNYQQAIYQQTIPLAHTNKMPCRLTRIIIHFSDQSCIFFNDLRKFGWIKLSPNQEKPRGKDILSSDFSLKYFQSLILKSQRPIKQLLLDQNKLAGIGNIYANEALFLAKINPKARNLNLEQSKKLYRALLKTIHLGIKHQGSSASDQMYILPNGLTGKHQNYLMVYQKEKQPCINCQTPIKKIKQGGRSSFYCPNCQK